MHISAELVVIIEVEGAPHGLDVLIKFSVEHWEKWSDHVGRKQVLDLANAEWNQINQGHGWVASIQHAIQQVVPAVHEVREQWNPLSAYELCKGTLLKLPNLVFSLGELEKDKPEIWVKRLDQYRVAYMKVLPGKGQKVENSEGGGGSPSPQGGMQGEIVDSSGGTPET